MKKIMNKNVLIGFGFGFLLSAVLFFIGGVKITNRALSGNSSDLSPEQSGVDNGDATFFDFMRDRDNHAKIKGAELKQARINLFTRADLKKFRRIRREECLYRGNLGFVQRIQIWLAGVDSQKADSSCGINNYFDEYRYKTDSRFMCDLSGADMLELDLSGALLNFSNLSGADLSGANMSNIQATGADFKEANLSGANLQDANLALAIFRDANLTGANFTGADLFMVDFRGSNLTNVNFTNANLFRVMFEHEILPGESANLTGANFTGAKVRPYQVEYLESQGISGFVVEEAHLMRTVFF